MATIVNNPSGNSSGSNLAGLVIALILIVALALLLIYGIPALSRVGRSSAPSINVPDKVDVNINKNP